MSREGEWIDLRVLVVNTHVGILLRTAVRWLLTRERYHVVLLQECGRPLARLWLRLVLPPKTWKLVGVKPPSTGRGSSGTIVATRRQRLRYVSSTNSLITAQRFVNGRRDKWHPERRLTRGIYVDRRTKHELMISSVHPWHIKGGPGEVVAAHDAQVSLYGAAARNAHRLLQLAIMGGDVNETRPRGPMREAMAAANMRTLSWGHIDALFVSDAVDVRCVAIEEVDLSRFRGGEPQHPAISARLQLRVLTTQPTDDD